MSAALVQTLPAGRAASTAATLTNGATPVSVGHHVLAKVFVRDSAHAATCALSDSGGNTWQQDGTAFWDATNFIWTFRFSVHITSQIAATTGTITATTSGGTVTQVTLLAVEVSGIATSSWLRAQQAAGPTSSNSPSSGNTNTTPQAGDFSLGGLYYKLAAGAASAGAGYTLYGDGNLGTSTTQACAIEYGVLGSGGAQAATYSLTSSGSWDAEISVYAAAAASAPANTVAPAVTGTATVGSVLTTTNGTWTDDGSPTFTYQWQRDVAGNGTYGNISSATSSTYTLVAADDTCHVRCVVTDTDSNGSTAANSNATAIVTYPVPTNSVAPTVSGNAVVGSVLTATTGTWANSPTSYGYQWTQDGSDIASATSSTYTTVAGDVTHAVGCKVTATNDGGTASAVASSNTITVTAAPSLSTVAGKTGTSGSAVMQKAKSGWTYITGKTGTSGTAVDQKGAGSYTKIKGH